MSAVAEYKARRAAQVAEALRAQFRARAGAWLRGDPLRHRKRDQQGAASLERICATLAMRYT